MSHNGSNKILVAVCQTVQYLLRYVRLCNDYVVNDSAMVYIGKKYIRAEAHNHCLQDENVFLWSIFFFTHPISPSLNCAWSDHSYCRIQSPPQKAILRWEKPCRDYQLSSQTAQKWTEERGLNFRKISGSWSIKKKKEVNCRFCLWCMKYATHSSSIPFPFPHATWRRHYFHHWHWTFAPDARMKLWNYDYEGLRAGRCVCVCT